MNPTDRKIAELKGLPAEGEITHWPVGEDDKGRVFPTGDPSPQNWGWSISDSKALELVDEMRALGWFFLLQDMRDRTWRASFINDESGTGMQAGATRPEAICRAYIAAREWMAAQGGGRVGSGGFGS
jgi:hypothetical protein